MNICLISYLLFAILWTLTNTQHAVAGDETLFSTTIQKILDDADNVWETILHQITFAFQGNHSKK
jgi:hypothetical protein